MEDKKTVSMIDERKVKKLAIWGGIGLVLAGIGVYRFGFRNGSLTTAVNVQNAILKSCIDQSANNQPTES